MIEKMKSVFLVCLEQDRERAVKALRQLEVMDVSTLAGNDAEDVAAAMRESEQLQRIIVTLEEAASAAAALPDNLLREASGKELAAAAQEALDRQAEARDQLEQARRASEQLSPWGDFDLARLDHLREHGIDVRLCAAPDLGEVDIPDAAVVQVIHASKALTWFVVISDRDLEDANLPEVKLPELRLSEAEDRAEEALAELARQDDRLATLAGGLDRIRHYLEQVLDRYDYVAVREGMQSNEHFVWLSGYVPARRMDELSGAARDHGWGLLLTDPEEDDRNVPTLLRLPHWLNIAMPIFDFIGIRPGYRELDVSLWFLIFMLIFFAMIFGDAGYGVLLTLGAAAGLVALPKKSREMKLLLFFGLSTLAWGWLQGNWFGVTGETWAGMPGWMRGIAWFHDNQNVQWLCFLIGAIHLSIGHGWRVLLLAPHLSFLAQVGWTVAVWANFFLAGGLVAGRAYPPYLIWMYAVAVVLIIFFAKPRKNVFKGAALGLGELASNGVNSFVDVVSYIRLFAVGLSGYYVARSFNQMGMDLAGNVFGLLVGIVVIFFGHVLNLALAALGVLVHGIRLNTLEFSNHIGLEWAGRAFRPFARRVRDNTQEQKQ